MRIEVRSTSRADHGPLRSVHEALRNGKRHEISWRQDWGAITCEMRHSPEMVVLLGDRFETLEAAFRLNLGHVAIAHLSGGDVTQGSQDDCFRHAITKLAHLHFPTNDDAARRIVQMGEEPWRVHMVGSPSIDGILGLPLMPRTDMLSVLGLLDGPFVLISLHPHTFGRTADEIAALREYLAAIPSLVGKVFIGPNADAGHELIEQEFSRLAGSMVNAVYVPHLDRAYYLSLMKHCDEMIGNSSALLYEAPTLGTKTRMIGDRQKGRVPIIGDGKAAQRIAEVIYRITDPKTLLVKTFNDIGQSMARKVA